MIKSISLRILLLGEAFSFLQQEDMGCLDTQAGMVDLVSRLTYYQEEGKPFYPEVFVFDDIELIKKMLPGSQFCHIGSGNKTKDTFLAALKKCAPLTEGGWAIYILRQNTTFDFGVFRTGTSRLSVPAHEVLLDRGISELKAFYIHQVSQKTIEVKGIKADPLLINFGSQEDSISSPLDLQANFIESIIEKVDIDIKDQTRNFLKRIFLDVLQYGHGSIVCVISSQKRNIPLVFKDGIHLDPFVNIQKSIKDFKDKNDLQANAELEGIFSLITGMMKCDGITIFTNKAEVICYNVFIKHSKNVSEKNTSGGARSRTYLTLCEWVDKNIKSAYIQSQDGKIEYSNGRK